MRTVTADARPAQILPLALLVAPALVGAAAIATGGAALGILIVEDGLAAGLFLVALVAGTQIAYRLLLGGVAERQAQTAFRSAMAAAHRAAMLRCLTEASSDAVLVVGWRGRVQFGNAAAARLFGRPSGEALSDASVEDLLREAMPESADAVAAAIAGEPAAGPVTIEALGRGPGSDACRMTVSVSTATLRLGRDPRERRRNPRTVAICVFRPAQTAGAQTPAVAAPAETALRLQAELMASMSHELRTPLNAIIGFAEMLEQQLLGRLGDARYRSYASYIRESGQGLLRVITDILGFVQIETGRFPLRLTEVDLKAAIAAGAAEEAATTAARGLRFETRVAEDLPPLRTDEAVLHHLLRHLLNHTARQTRDGAVIEIAARRFGPGMVEIAVTGGTVPTSGAAMPLPTRGIGLAPMLARSLAGIVGAELTFDDRPDGCPAALLRLPAARPKRQAG